MLRRMPHGLARLASLLIFSSNLARSIPSRQRVYSLGKDFVEGVVCKESDVPENGMKEFALDEGKVLLVRQKGNLYAVGTKCTHYGAPLVTGAIGNGRIRCPWHGACFGLKTGDIEDFPGLDSLPCYDVSVLENGDVKVRGKKSLLGANKRVKNMVKKSTKCVNTYVIIGGGAAGSSCAETLRQEGFCGRLVIISSEKNTPYDRVKVSKNLDSDISKILLRSDDFYRSNDIEILTNEIVSCLDVENNVVTTESGKEFNYSKLFVASGVRSRKPKMIEGFELENIHTVYTIEDANAINQKLTKDINVVVVGSSFIGMETAAFCNGKVKSVTVVGRSSVPFENVFGYTVGARIATLYETKGVQLVMKNGVSKFEGDGTKLTKVILTDGCELDADLCIVGIGTEFNTEFLQDTSVTLSKGAVEVDEYLKTNVENVFAGGDVAYAPVFANKNRKSTIAHWQLAQYHGHIAALNMVGKQTKLKSVPFFFSMLFGFGIRYAGYGVGFTDTVIVGDLDNLKFCQYYLRDDEAIAVVTVGFDPVAAQFAELLFNGRKLTKADVLENNWVKTYNVAE